MWSAGSEHHLYLDRAMLQNLDAALGEWKSALPEGTKRPMAHVWLSGALAVPFMLLPVDGLRNRAEALRLAVASACGETGLQGECTVWLDAWKPGRPCLSVAMQRESMAAIRVAAREAGVTLKSVQPWWNWALTDRLRRQDAMRMLAIVEDDALTVLAGDGERITSVKSQCPKPEPERIDAQLRRQAINLGVVLAEVLRVSMHRRAGEGDPAPGGTACWQEQGL